MIARGTAPHVWELSRSAHALPFAYRREFWSWIPKGKHLQKRFGSFVPPLGDPDLLVRSHNSIWTVSL
ncbi:hypothetical protein ACRRTK_000766 [Alexandromys fortis]